MHNEDLLALAAKAAGIVASMRHQRMHKLERNGKWTPWNPLDNDADALRLAVDLKICLMYKTYPHAVYVEAYAGQAPNAMEPIIDIRRSMGFDQNEAVRRAIVRAACAIAQYKK